MRTDRIGLVFVTEESDRTGPADDLARILPGLAMKFAPVVIFRHEAGLLAIDLQHAGAVVHDLGSGEGKPPPRFAAATATVHRLVRILKELDPGIVHGLDEPSSRLVAVAGRIAGVPILVGSLRGHASQRPGFAARAAFRRLDRLVVPSEALRLEASSILRGRHPPIVVVPPAVDARALRGRARAPEFSEPRLRIGTIARLGRGCGIDLLIDAALALPPDLGDVEWLVAGVGRQAIPYLRETQRRGADRIVRLLGDLPDPGPFLAAVDAYVSPGGPDALPHGLLCALAAGVPSVAVANPSLESLLGAGRGACLAAPDATALAGAVARVLAADSHPLRMRLREAGAGAVASLTPRAEASSWRGLYDEVVEAARRGGG